ncbi:MAG: hypothetical protein NTU85_02240 [Candidatus Kaiserbacteria bacterium]|nr:hypothetical protein [Candidatus Kaiserbacteria bacterium]
MALNTTNHPIRWKERIGIIATGHAAKLTESLLFDHFLYGVVVNYLTITYGWMWGAVASFLVMSPISALECRGLILLYDWAKKDFFGFEKAKEFCDELSKGGKWKRFLNSLIRLSDVLAFFILSTIYPGADPFLATIYLRKGAEEYNGMTKRDWKIFWAAVVVANGYWTLRWTVFVALFWIFLWPVLIKPMVHWLGF